MRDQARACVQLAAVFSRARVASAPPGGEEREDEAAKSSTFHVVVAPDQVRRYSVPGSLSPLCPHGGWAGRHLHRHSASAPPLCRSMHSSRHW